MVMNSNNPSLTTENMEASSLQDWSYELVFRQQPDRARVRPPADNTRTIDPPPILEIVKVDQLGTKTKIIVANPYLTVRVQMYNESSEKAITHSSRIPKGDPLLLGNLMVNGQCFTDDLGETCLLAPFPDLSIRCAGRFTLKFSLYDLSSTDPITLLPQLGARARVHHHVFTLPFRVHKPASYPGVVASNALTYCLAAKS